MKRLIALMALLGTLTACSAPAEPAATEQKETPAAEESVTAEPPASLDDKATFSAAAPEKLTYSVTLETLEDTSEAGDGTVLIHRTYTLPVISVETADGTAVTEASTPAETEALTVAQTFNDQFRAWAASDGADEMAAGAEEDRAFRAESGLEWHPYELELDCSLYQTEELISVQAEYYSYTGGAHPNTVLLAWNYDLTTGQFLTPEQLAADGQAFSEAVRAELLRQSQETAADNDMAPEEYFWSNYEEILAGWSSYAVSFDETGMTVGFSPFELAAYAAGPQIYHLPYETFTGYLSIHGLAMLGLAAAGK